MSIVKKIDDVGRVAIPKDLRRSLRWMGGDEIEIIPKEDGTILLRRHEDDTIARLKEMSSLEWVQEQPDIEKQFLDLIELIQSKTE